MSCWNWEKGTIKLPSKEWAKLKEKLRDAWNIQSTRRYKLALEVYETMSIVLKGKRGLDWHKVYVDDYYRRQKLTPQECLKLTLLSHRELDEGNTLWVIERALFCNPDRTWRKKPVKPKKKDFPAANSKTTKYSLGDGAYIGLDNATKSVVWSVSENNHAVERAREHFLARVLFGALEQVVWSRTTGGTIVGNDEYNSEESAYEGGGANYACIRYGRDRKQHENQFQTKRQRVRR